MKKEVSPAVIVGAIAGLVVLVGLAIFFMIRSDPASQAPNPPPRFDPAAREAAEAHFRGPGPVPGKPINGGPPASPAPAPK